MQKFFRIPFATSGTKTAVPDAAAIDDSVSYTEGYPLGYQQDPAVDPLTAKDIERDKLNQLLFDTTTALKELQAHAIPDFITTALNGGAPWAYSKYDLVRWDNGAEILVYESLVDANTSLPSDATKWRQFTTSSFRTGMWVGYFGTQFIDGWIWPAGGTIGNASSNATNRANADTFDLFVQIWEGYSNALRPIFSSTGAASTRGVSAAADWAANKAITCHDMRGISPIGRDDMGGTPANRITTAGCGISGVTLGASGGSQSVILSSNQMPQHTHGLGSLSTSTAGSHAHTITRTSGSGPDGAQINSPASGSGAGVISTSTAGAHTHPMSGTLDNAGASEAHLNVQPSIVCNILLKL